MKECYLFLFGLCLTFFLAGCNKGINEKDESLINLTQLDKKNLLIDDFFKLKKIVFLETLPESLIKNINKIYFNDDKIIIMDASNRCILVYNSDGTFLNKISSVGRGPGEFTRPDDMIINVDGQLEVLDRVSRKIVKFSIDGHFISEYSLDFTALSFVKDKKENYYFYTANARNSIQGFDINPSIIITNRNFEVVDCMLDFDSKWLGRGFGHSNMNTHFFVNNEDNIILIPQLPFLLSTFNISNRKLELNHRFVVSDQANLENFLINLDLSRGFARSIYESGYIFGLSNYIEDNGYIFSSLDGKDSEQIIVNSSKNYYYSRNQLTYDNNHGLFNISPVYGDIKNLAVNIVSPFVFMYSATEIFKSVEHKLNENDNPVLIFYYFNPN